MKASVLPSAVGAFAVFLLVVVRAGLPAQAEEAQPRKINVNTASREELARLPGIGPAIAERIVRHREKNGPFRRIEELLIIRGINRKKFEKIRPLISVDRERGEKAKGKKPG